MPEKKSFIVYNDWRNAFEKMPDEAAGKLIKALFAFANGEDVSDLDWSIAAPLEQYKSVIVRDAEKWERQMEQRSEAGRRSAESRRRKLTKSNDRSTTVKSRARKATDSVSVSVSESVSVSASENNKSYNSLSENSFVQTVKTLNQKYAVLSKEGVEEFTNHWAEVNQNTKKMRWQEQDYFDTVKRMRKWASNNYSGKAKKPKIGDKGSEYKNQVF